MSGFSTTSPTATAGQNLATAGATPLTAALTPQDLYNQYASTVFGNQPAPSALTIGADQNAQFAAQQQAVSGAQDVYNQSAPAPTGTASAPNSAVPTTPSGTMTSPLAGIGSSGVAGKSSGMSQTPTPFTGTGGGTSGMSPAMQDFMKSQYFQGAYQNYFGSGQNGSNTPTI